MLNIAHDCRMGCMGSDRSDTAPRRRRDYGGLFNVLDPGDGRRQAGNVPGYPRCWFLIVTHGRSGFACHYRGLLRLDLIHWIKSSLRDRLRSLRGGGLAARRALPALALMFSLTAGLACARRLGGGGLAGRRALPALALRGSAGTGFRERPARRPFAG